MPITTNNHLYDLIQSLSKSEKRYFKLSMPESHKLTSVFDLINKQSNYNEEDILAKIFPGEKSGNLAVIKNRLYNQILKTLNQFHAEKSVSRQLKDRIHSVEILYKKGLFDQCLKIINAAKKIALKNDLHFYVLELNKWEKKLAVQFNYEFISLDEINAIYTEDQISTNKLIAYQEIWDIKSKLLKRLYNKGKSRDEADYGEFKKIIDTLKPKQEYHFDLESEFLYNHTLSAYYFSVLDYENSYKLVKENHILINENNKFYDEDPNSILSVLTNAIYLSQRTGKTDETQAYMVELENHYHTHEQGKVLALRLFTDKTATELSSLIMNGNFDNCAGLISEIEECLQVHTDEIGSTKLAGIYYGLAIANFGQRNYSKALSWINKILNELKINQSEDQYCFAQIMHMIIHIELVNDDYITYSMRSLKRYLKTRERMYAFESYFVEMIGRIIKTRKVEKKRELFADFANKMSELKAKRFENSPFEYFDFEAWAIGKSKELSYDEVLAKAV